MGLERCRLVVAAARRLLMHLRQDTMSRQRQSQAPYRYAIFVSIGLGTGGCYRRLADEWRFTGLWSFVDSSRHDLGSAYYIHTNVALYRRLYHEGPISWHKSQGQGVVCPYLGASSVIEVTTAPMTTIPRHDALALVASRDCNGRNRGGGQEEVKSVDARR